MDDIFDPLIGDTILVLYEKTNCYYEAKVIEKRHDNTSKKTEYRVHYSGWNKRWDEWVTSERLLKATPKNIETYGAVMSIRKRKRTFGEMEKETKRRARMQMREDEKNFENEENTSQKMNMSSTASPVSFAENDENQIEEREKRRRRRSRLSGSGMGTENGIGTGRGRGRGRGRANTIERENEKEKESKRSSRHVHRDVEGITRHHHDNDDDDDDDAKNTIDIYLPMELKKKLITDWEIITKHHKLMKLPRENGQRVVDILDHYCENSKDPQINKEVIRGLKDYFDQALDITLLYKFERSLHHSITRQFPFLKMSQIYGVEHLCRLFVKLPHLLNPNDLDQQTRITLEHEIKNIIELVLNSSHKYFVEEYQIPSEEYIRNAEHMEIENFT